MEKEIAAMYQVAPCTISQFGSYLRSVSFALVNLFPNTFPVTFIYFFVEKYPLRPSEVYFERKLQ